MITIGLGEYAITDTENEGIITHSLGSCVALILYCPISKCTSMAHIVLPERDKKHGLIQDKEAYYATDFVPKMIHFYLDKPNCDIKGLKAYVIGGAVSKNPADVFKIGERNVQIIENILKVHGIAYENHETLGSYSRTVEIHVNDGTVKIRKRNMII
ncbi:MAG: chemotaxis protein CheD [Clostridia bacterium]|nr:chemotaxis protein CheD [Clostridia bacterium]